MREITEHRVNPANDLIEIQAIDEPGDGGACHHYHVKFPLAKENCPQMPTVVLNFQNGPIPEVGVNGITQEVLIAICIDRLRGFQSGKFACPENAAALNGLESAQRWLHQRTQKRMDRGVEGTHEK